MLRIPARFTPFVLQKEILLRVMKTVFQEALEDGDFEFLENQWLKVEIRDLGLCWYISYENDKLQVAEHSSRVDVCFSGELNDLILVAAHKVDPDTLFFQRRLRIEGDTELGLEVKNLLDSIDLETLPKLMRQGLGELARFIESAQLDVSAMPIAGKTA
nr:SCP2 domain-containing protein [Dongshaea marina]